MNHKVLLADDSLTIQKVIRITLAGQPYDIVDCATEEELFKKLPEVQPKIVFLDFNLSDKFTGYELSKKIKEASPSTQILLLLGTFDTVDDDLMEKNGIAEKIVKPFDSNKFIAICKRLADIGDSFSVNYPETKELPESNPFAASEEDNWTVTRGAEVEVSAIAVEAQVTTEEFDALQSQMVDWGISVPDVIGVPSKPLMTDIPPVIDEEDDHHEEVTSTDQLFKSEPSHHEGMKMPSSEDLEWPTIDEMIEKPVENKDEASAPKSKLISIESFSIEEDQSVNDQWAMQKLYGQDTESDVKSIEDQIRDEIENDLWSADEIESKPKLKVVKEESSQEEKHEFKPTLNDFDESLFEPLDDHTIPWHETTPSSSNEKTLFNKEELMNELRPLIEESVKKAVKEYLDQYLKQSVEKVTWEVIPDLAENLIRQELNKISQQILGE